MDDITSTSAPDQSNLIELTADIVSAYVSKNSVPVSEMPALLSAIHGALNGLISPVAQAEAKIDRATPSQIRKSITHDALISFEDGRPYKTLKRHLKGVGLTPDEYRAKWGLPRDYPMTAPSYSEMRSALAKNTGLGNLRRNAAAKAAAADETVAVAPKARGRKKAAEPVAAPAEKPARGRKTKKAAVAAE
ncbi:MucR family transcriptional regulator [Methylobacterium sp. Leaf361]|uniref:MucR family transcriptional regulator n=1 Tax=Methylobacterium sp. Leaf361 TaxID=1736352 RepID=UPI0006F2E997|nr:MucR family transcriptional regulator [Methylobacterium sp. Leaf361]KQS52876.1 MucR family transcriptional regulator [Methylobacterium sp. Leaf361]